jgi:NADP-dependent 3-hydroxy acid dehydrogenase YdfG
VSAPREDGPRTALVVGATSELGAALATALAAAGYDVQLWGRNPDRLGVAADRVRRAGRAATPVVVDVRDRRRLDRAVARLDAAAPLAVAVWAAGLFDWALADAADADRWDDVFDVNLSAAAHWSALIAPRLVRAAPARLVLLGSGAGHTAYRNNAAYVASKHGLVGLGRALFQDLRDRGVGVSVLSPAIVDAGGGRLAPAGPKLDVADVVAALRYIVGCPPRCCPTEVLLQPVAVP